MAKAVTKTTTGNGKVLRDVYVNLAGDVIENNDAALAKAYKEIAEGLLEEGEELETMTDAEAAALVRAVPGDGRVAEINLARGKAIYDYVPRRPDNISAIKGDYEASNIGASLDAETMDHWQQFADKEEDVRGVPLVMAQDLERQIGKARILAMPIPGTREGKPQTWPTAEFNGPFEHYDKTDGTKVSYYPSMYDASQVGKINRRFNELVKNLGKEGGIGNLLQGEASEFEQLQVNQGSISRKTAKEAAGNVHLRNQLIAWNDNRRGSVIRKLRITVNYVQRKDQIESIDGFRIFMAEKDAIACSKRNKPIEIVYTDADGKPHSSGVISIGQLIRLKPWQAKAVAEAKGEELTLAELQETAKRAPGKGGKNQVPEIKSLNQARLYLYAWVNWVQEAGQDNATALLEACNVEGSEGDDMIKAVHRAARSFDFVCTKTTVRHNRLIAREAKQREEAAEKEDAA